MIVVVEGRSYRQFCGVAHALDLVGERWALLVVRDLILGPKRFTDLQAGLPGIGTNILSARLKLLERGGVVRRRILAPPAASTVYELTEYGRELEAIVLALGRWGAKGMAERGQTEALRPEWLALALRAFFRPEAARDVRVSWELRLDGSVFDVRVDEGEVEVAIGPADDPDITLEAEIDVFLGLLAGPLAPAEAAGGSLRLTGDPKLLGKLIDIFRLTEDEAAHA